MTTQPSSPESTPPEPTTESAPQAAELREFAPIIPFTSARIAHPTRGGEVVSAADMLNNQWNSPRVESNHAVPLSPAKPPKTVDPKNGTEYSPRRVEGAVLAGKAAVQRMFRWSGITPVDRTPLPDIPSVRADIPKFSANQPDASEREAARQAAIEEKMRLREEDTRLKAAEQALRRRDIDLRQRALDLREAQLDQGILPDDRPLTGLSKSDEKKSTHDKATARYNENLALIERYEQDPTHGHLFDVETLKTLHTAIQEAAWPLYEARLAELNDSKPDDEKIPSVEAMPAREKRPIIDPIDASYTHDYIMSRGGSESDELMRALTLARLKAVGKLQKPRKPQA